MQTFRRSSLATNSSQPKDTSRNSNAPASAGLYVPPHMNANYQINQSSFARNGDPTEARYSKEQLLDIFKAQGSSGPSIADLFVDGWSPATVNGSGSGGWGKRDEYKDAPTAADVCWDHEGSTHPLSLIEMSEEEKQV